MKSDRTSRLEVQRNGRLTDAQWYHIEMRNFLWDTKLLNKLYLIVAALHSLLGNFKKKMLSVGSNPIDPEFLSIYGFEKSTGHSNMQNDYSRAWSAGRTWDWKAELPH